MTVLPFTLPTGFKPLVGENDKIKEGQVLAENSKPSEVSINVAQDLEIPIRKVRTVLKKLPGQSIEEGDLIAEKKGIMGGKMIKSTISGTASRIDEETGSLIVSMGGDSQQSQIMSPVDGTVSMVSDTKILIKTEAEAIVADKFSGKNYTGEVERLTQEGLRDVGSVVDDKVVVVPSVSREELAKLLALGAGAVVASNIEDATFANLENKNIDAPVLRIAEKDLDSLKSSKKISVDGEKGVVLKL
jgi:hypothetical protein